MTDHKELIAEGHHLGLSDDEATDYGDQYRRLIQRLTVALTDALEAAQPRQIDPRVLADIILRVAIYGGREGSVTTAEDRDSGAYLDCQNAADAVIAYLSPIPATGEVEWEYRYPVRSGTPEAGHICDTDCHEDQHGVEWHSYEVTP